MGSWPAPSPGLHARGGNRSRMRRRPSSPFHPRGDLELAAIGAWEPMHLLVFRITPARPVILQDIERWISILREGPDGAVAVPESENTRLSALIRTHPEFRTLFYYRVRHGGGRAARALCALCAIIRP